MFLLGTGSASGDLTASSAYGAASAYYQRVEAGYRPWPLKEVGTGGTLNVAFLSSEHGYAPCVWVETVKADTVAPFADLMQQVRRGFGRTMSRLPEVFGVSRQTLYNWLDGETPKDVQQERIKQLAAAARVFEDMGFKPTASALDRTLSQGQSFLQLLSQGGDGRNLAQKLIRVGARSQVARSKLDELIGSRKVPLGADAFGAPSLNEDA